MSFLVKEINLNKWKPHEKLKVADVPSNAITGCLRRLMSFLVRKINLNKWKPQEKLKVADVPSDAITGCLRTSANTLSVWELNLHEEEKIINEGILAIVTGPKKKHIETIYVVLLKPEELKTRDFEIVKEEGDTCVKDLVQNHRTILNLTYAKLGEMADIILNHIHSDNVKRRNKLYITDLIIKAIKDNRLELNSLDEKIQGTIICRYTMLGEDVKDFFK
jgi:hypothetical protein